MSDLVTQEISPAPLQVVDVKDLDWQAVRNRANPSLMRSTIRPTVERMEALLDKADGPGMLFDNHRADHTDKVIKISDLEELEVPLWFIGDLHGDLLALEAALAAIELDRAKCAEPRIVFLGDLFDDEGFGLEVLLRVFELVVDAPDRICVLAGNHDEALSYDGVRFASRVSPSDFAEFLNANLAHEWIERTGKLAVRLFANAPRALFFPDGLLAAHGGFPLLDLHPQLAESGNWNDPPCLSDFVWTRAHPKARRKLPNRFTRGSQFGYGDFAAFCSLSADLGRPVSRMVRGHDHVEDRYATFPAYRDHPLLTTVALSHRLSRESFGPYERIPTIAQFVEGALPRVYRLHIPTDVIREVYPEPQPDSALNELNEGPQS
ncbi:metallophosphoesterase [Rhizobium tubonense]|nr:metallophosphoesterase [Rhizobium tubonense]